MASTSGRQTKKQDLSSQTMCYTSRLLPRWQVEQLDSTTIWLRSTHVMSCGGMSRTPAMKPTTRNREKRERGTMADDEQTLVFTTCSPPSIPRPPSTAFLTPATPTPAGPLQHKTDENTGGKYGHELISPDNVSNCTRFQPSAPLSLRKVTKVQKRSAGHLPPPHHEPRFTMKALTTECNLYGLVDCLEGILRSTTEPCLT